MTILLYQTNPLRIELYFYANIIFVAAGHLSNQRGSESHLVNTKEYKAKFSLIDVSVNDKKYYGMIYAVK